MQSRVGGEPGERWRVSGFTTSDPLGHDDEPLVSLEIWASGFVLEGGYLVLKFHPNTARAWSQRLAEMADHAEEK